MKKFPSRKPQSDVDGNPSFAYLPVTGTLPDILFRRKSGSDAPDTLAGPRAEEVSALTKPSPFWRGEIENFSDNFYRNSSDPIKFAVTVRFNRDEILALSLPQGFISALSRKDAYDHLVLEGKIEQVAGDRARIQLEHAEFNRKGFYGPIKSKRKTPGSPSPYLPGFDKVSDSAKLDIFNKIMGKLDDGFLLIPASRSLTNELEVERGKAVTLSPERLKNWLYQVSLDRDREKLFRQVMEQFSQAPFKHGRVSIARLGLNEIEILVEDGYNVKLPIGRKGSGVQQILTILSYIAQSKSSFIGVEEPETNLSPSSQFSMFTDLHRLANSKPPSLGQIFITTHSPHIAKRNEAERRVVWMEEGETYISKPGGKDLDGFFRLA